MDIHDFTALVGETPRQIRFLVAEGFIPSPTGGRARAQYGAEHAEAVRRYRWLREQYAPQQIKLLMKAHSPMLRLPVAPGVELHIDLSLIGASLDAAAVAGQVRHLLATLPPPDRSTTVPEEKDPTDAA